MFCMIGDKYVNVFLQTDDKRTRGRSEHCRRQEQIPTSDNTHTHILYLQYMTAYVDGVFSG